MTFAIALTFAFSAPLLAEESPEEGIWTNTEDAYFAEAEGREKPVWVSIEVSEDKRWRRTDPFGQPLEEWQAGLMPGLVYSAESGWSLDGSELRKARLFSCWASVRKFAGKPDGTEDWSFSRGLSIHDQGGRISVPGNGEAPDVLIRLRNVTWAKDSSNKPSLVLYVHRNDPERAESYAWASPDASLIGINLRWVQASCSPAVQ
ncbi:hypothetical protein [Altererythrobacter sp. GH1-8]|uniref:hypothetical protein n=1 Tax=Altererythrobacter sp. GH1-8 TaxID=3349333 RepID=UPI00374D4087